MNLDQQTKKVSNKNSKPFQKKLSKKQRKLKRLAEEAENQSKIEASDNQSKASEVTEDKIESIRDEGSV